MYLRRYTKRSDIVIPAGVNQSSDAIESGFFVYGGVSLPNLGASTSIKFEVSMDGSTWHDAVSDRNEALSTIDSSAAKFVIIPFECFAANFFRITVAGTTASESTLKSKFYS